MIPTSDPTVFICVDMKVKSKWSIYQVTFPCNMFEKWLYKASVLMCHYFSLSELNTVTELTYLLTFAFGHLWGEVSSALLFWHQLRVGWFHLCACVTKSCSEPLTCEHQPLISSSSKVTRPPKPRAWCHNTPSFCLSSLSDAPQCVH